MSAVEAMGRRKFRLSDVIPNAWFYKLRDMHTRGRGRGGSGGGGGAVQQPPPSSSLSPRRNRAVQQPAPTPTNDSSALPRRASYYYTTRDRELSPPLAPQPRVTDTRLFPRPQSPSRSPKTRTRHRVGPVRGEHAPARGGGSSASAPVSAPRLKPVVREPGTSQCRRHQYIEYDGGESRRRRTVSDDNLHGKVIRLKTDIIFDLGTEDTHQRALRPIMTRTVRRQLDPYEPEYRRFDLADVTTRASSASEKSSTGKPRRWSVSSSGLRLKTRTNSPRLQAARTGKPPPPPTEAAVWKSTRLTRAPPALADSYAVVELSRDPRRDFLESMEAMIAEKGIRDTASLEDLLACYLSLNAAEHHDLIIEVFEQIWMSLAVAKH